jgi:lysozyme family protein
VNNTAVVIARILLREGGVADVGDGKGATSYGQTPGWLADWGFQTPENDVQAAVNYRRWMQLLRLDQVCELDLELGDGVADFAVHSGHTESIRALQRAVNVPADGVIGPATLAAIQKAPQGTAVRFECQRLRFVGKLLGSKKIDRRKYASGWCNRLADRIESAARSRA